MTINNGVLIKISTLDIKEGRVVIPKHVTHIGNWAFRGCTGITALTLPGSEARKCKTIDGMLCIILRQKAFNNEIEYYKAQYFKGMRNSQIALIDCHILESNNVFSHGITLKAAMRDLQFKLAKDRGADQYRKFDKNHQFPFEEAVAMYRIITGACQFGTEHFILSLGNKVQISYSPEEIIKVTAGQYGSETFEAFWEGSD
jgi:hypothetical protein